MVDIHVPRIVQRLAQLHQSGAADSPVNLYLLVTKHLLKVGTHTADIPIDFPGRDRKPGCFGKRKY